MAVTKPTTTAKSIKDLWCTPVDVVRRLEQVFGLTFDLDVCGTFQSQLTPKTCVYAPQFVHDQKRLQKIGIYLDGLQQDWHKLGRVGFMNPEFSVKEQWIAKAEREARKGFTTIGLLPVAQCTNWYKDMEQGVSDIYTPDRRISYVHPITGKLISGVNFETIVAVWRPRAQIIYNRFSLEAA